MKNAVLPHHGAVTSAKEKSSGAKFDLTDPHAFGCRVWVKHTLARSKKCNVDTKKGRFLGHVPGSTVKNALWVDDVTGHIKLGHHQLLDEGMNNLTLLELPPNARVFHQSGKTPAPEEATVDKTEDVNMFHSADFPFKSERTFTVKVCCMHPTFGIILVTDDLFH
jgi:hypothetical protein